MMRLLLTVLVLATCALAAQNQPSDPARGRMARAIKIIPVPHLVAAMPPPAPLPVGTMIDCAPGVEERRPRPLAQIEDEDAGRFSDLAALLRDLTPLSWDDGNVNVDLVGNALVVTGSPDQIHLVEQSLQKVTASVGEPFLVRAMAFSFAGAIELPAVATSYAEARGKLTELGAAVLWEQTSSAIAGQVVELGALTTQSYVGDIDVEIAQSFTMANPIVRPMRVGTAVQVQVHPLVGHGDAVILAHYASGEPAAPLREVALGKDEALTRLQIPSVALDAGTFSGRIKNGGALLVVANGPWSGRNFGLLVGAERAQVAAEVEREVGLLSLGAFLSHALRWQYEVPRIDGQVTAIWTPALVTAEQALPIDPADQQTWDTLFARALGEEQANVGIDRMLALVRGPSAANMRPTVARLIELLQEQFFKTVEVEFRVDAAGARDTANLQRLRFPVLFGRTHVLTHGTETAGVSDADCEVAQKAGISDPKVGRHFTGADCTLVAYGVTPTETALDCDVRLTDTVADRVYLADNQRGIRIDQPAITRANLSHHGKVAAEGKAVEFGDGPELRLGEQRLRTRCSLRARMR
jgi:hypothetical protein